MNKRKSDFALALYELMKTDSFSDITISDICNKLDCSRQSFYYYYKSLEECLTYYVKELVRSQVKDYIITDTFTLMENYSEFIGSCEKDPKIYNLFWAILFNHLKKQLDIILSKNLVDYLSLYPDQKDILLCFYVAGVINEARSFYMHGFCPEKEKYIGYCKSIFGTYEEMRTIVKRFLSI